MGVIFFSFEGNEGLWLYVAIRISVVRANAFYHAADRFADASASSIEKKDVLS